MTLSFEHIDSIFTDSKEYLPASIPEADPVTIADEVDRSDFDPIFAKLDRFDPDGPDDYDYDLCRLETSDGKECALIRTWTHLNASRLIFYVLKERFAIVFATSKTFLIVGNQDREPFVYTPKFTFNDPDGYFKVDTLDFPTLSLYDIKELLQETVFEYIYPN